MILLSQKVIYCYATIQEKQKHVKEMTKNEWAIDREYIDYEGDYIVEFVKEW